MKCAYCGALFLVDKHGCCSACGAPPVTDDPRFVVLRPADPQFFCTSDDFGAYDRGRLGLQDVDVPDWYLSTNEWQWAREAK